MLKKLEAKADSLEKWKLKVRDLQNIGKEYIVLATFLLKEPIHNIVESNVAKMIEKCIDLAQLKALRALHEMVKWYKDVRRVRDLDEKIPMEEVIIMLLSDGHNLNKVDEVDDLLV